MPSQNLPGPTTTASQAFSPGMVEARLLYLENMTSIAVGDDFRCWAMGNTAGTPLSPAQIPQAPPPLFTGDIHRAEIIKYVTKVLKRWPFVGAPRGWTGWFVGTLAEQLVLLFIKFGRQLYHIGTITCETASAIIVRYNVSGNVQSSEAPEKVEREEEEGALW